MDYDSIIGNLKQVSFFTSGVRIYICENCKKPIEKGQNHIVFPKIEKGEIRKLDKLAKKHYHISCWKNE